MLDNLIAAVAGAAVAVVIYEYFRPQYRPALTIDHTLSRQADRVVRLDKLVTALEHGLRGG